jgi:hypothetical protein
LFTFAFAQLEPTMPEENCIECADIFHALLNEPGEFLVPIISGWQEFSTEGSI